jgi:hypothetical protein
MSVMLDKIPELDARMIAALPDRLHLVAFLLLHT